MTTKQRHAAITVAACVWLGVVIIGILSTTQSPNGDSFQDRVGPDAGPVIVPTEEESASNGPEAPQVGSFSSSRELFDAIYAVESISGKELVGDNGRSRGPYHISRAYWDDAWDDANEWLAVHYPYDLVNDKDTCEFIMQVYWYRYGATTDEERMALHVAGPTGIAKMETSEEIQRYIERVKAIMEQGD